MELQEMQNEVDRFFNSLNVDTLGVVVCDDQREIATALGLYARGTVPILNLPVNAAFGFVYLDVNYLNRELTSEQQRFILAHEVSHIYLNHVIPKAIAKLFDELLKRYDRDLHTVLDIVRLFLYLLGVPPPLVALTKDQELAADIMAISLTGNESAAKDCLTRLVGGDLDRRSHKWEALGVQMPVMTMRERLQEIQRRIGETRRYRLMAPR